MNPITLTQEHVGKPFIQLFGKIWPVQDFMGRVIPDDIGRKVYLMTDNTGQNYLAVSPKLNTNNVKAIEALHAAKRILSDARAQLPLGATDTLLLHALAYLGSQEHAIIAELTS